MRSDDLNMTPLHVPAIRPATYLSDQTPKALFSRQLTRESENLNACLFGQNLAFGTLPSHWNVRDPAFLPELAMLQRLQHAGQTVRHLTSANYGTFRGWVRNLLAQLEWVTGRMDRFVTVRPANVKRLVFVCLGNINRSAFAEAVARSRGVRVCSLGLATTTGAPAFETAIATAERFGIDLSVHTATDLSDFSYLPGDLLLTMEIRHVHRLIANGIPASAIALLGAWSSPRRLHLHDPALQSEDYFMTCFALIHSAIINLVEELRTGGSSCLLP